MTKCKLIDPFVDINEEAQKMYYRLVSQLIKQERVTEQQKADNQMLWVQP